MRRIIVIVALFSLVTVASPGASNAAWPGAPSAASPGASNVDSPGAPNVASPGAPAAVPATPAWRGLEVSAAQQKGRPGRGDDLARVKAWRAFLVRAHRAFFAARLPVSEVKAKIKEADARLRELEARGAAEQTGRPDITGDVAFLKKAHRAFTAAHMSTTNVKKWLREAQKKGADQ